MQLGLGLKLAIKGLSSVMYSDADPTELRPALALDGWLPGCIAAAFILVSTLPKDGTGHQAQQDQVASRFAQASARRSALWGKLATPPCWASP